ncbi:MAG TPA: glucosamine--fructose-6-phosphate aminotransferase [Cyanobacteria bacterium UBA8530]|nr:glucosamine--fructose-6-phosphate aminotransferase [Cyanobacteria bacterium UBA8530]
MLGQTMLGEIHEQPRCLSRLLEREFPRVLGMGGKRPRLIMLAARGTSDNAAHYAKYLFECQNGIPTALAAPSVLGIYEARLDLKDVLIIGISQSGQAADVIAFLEKGEKMGARTLAITNEVDSPLARIAMETIPCHAGREEAVAATKTYTSTLLALLMLSAAFDRDQSLISSIERLPDRIVECLSHEEGIRRKVERFRYLEQCVVLGRGFNLCTALELSLKLRETCYIQAQPFAAPDFLHGPIAVVERGYPVLAIAAEGAVLSSLLEVIGQVKKRGAEAVVFTNSAEIASQGDHSISFGAGLPEVLSPFPAIVAGQVFAQALALIRGIDPDSPRGLCKVTVTR